MAKPKPKNAQQRVRLQKFLSDAGVASRRRAEEWILEGRVLVNDEPVTELPAFVDPHADRVIANGEPVRPPKLEYFVVHKPKGFLCTNRDPSGRRRVIDLLPPDLPPLVPVGRLDMDTMGLVLMTNDGELTHRVTHPRYGLPKVYRAEVAGRIAEDVIDQLRRGVYIAEGRAKASEARVVRAGAQESTLEITLTEGRNRQIRRMLAQCGHKVRRLVRIKIGPLSLKGLPVGACRRLLPGEVKELKDTIRKSRRPLKPRGARTRKRAEASSSPTKVRAKSPSSRRKRETPRRRVIS
jgi:23S rRNA pseudouridine2605 synthase